MIPVNGAGQFHADLQMELRLAFNRVLSSGRFVLGPEVEAFEHEWAAASGSPFAVGVASGLDAIELGLRAMGVGPGDEVIAPALTAAPTVLGILRSGASPVLADVDAGTVLLDPESATRLISPRTAAVLVVHLYGRLADLRSWGEWAERHGVALIEDAAQAHLAEDDGITPGKVGRFAAYSFYPTKNLGAIGDAGAIVTHDPDLAERVRRLRNYGQVQRYRHEGYGVNSRLDELQAAFLRVRLKRLAAESLARRSSVDLMRSEIINPVVVHLATPRNPLSHVHHLHVVRTGKRDLLQRFLAGRGVGTDVHYPKALNAQPALSSLRRDPLGLRRAEQHAATCITLPAGHHLSEADVRTIVSAVNDYIE